MSDDRYAIDREWRDAINWMIDHPGEAPPARPRIRNALWRFSNAVESWALEQFEEELREEGEILERISE